MKADDLVIETADVKPCPHGFVFIDKCNCCNGWINIKDRLPNDSPVHAIYIVAMYSHKKMKGFVEPMHYIDANWYTIMDEEPLDLEYEITHWMPLPWKPQ